MFQRLASLILTLFMAQHVLAHEVRPGVMDVSFDDGMINARLIFNAEVALSGMDVSEVADTNNTPQSDEYDRLRALEPTQLQELFQRNLGAISNLFVLQVDGMSQVWDVTNFTAGVVGDVRLPRDSVLLLSAKIPAQARHVQIGWAESQGRLVVRDASSGTDGFAILTEPGGVTKPIGVDGSITQSSFLEVLGEYIPVGIDHIVPKGLDHILFVLGLFFFSARLGPLLGQVSLFTIAHTITLALATLELVSLPATIVEPLIALSITYVALENVMGTKFGPVRLGVIFLFGLLHGLGFASVLGEFGLPEDQLVAALIGFNIGVEFGQIIVLIPALILFATWAARQDWYRPAIQIPASLAIGAVGFYWFVERVFL